MPSQGEQLAHRTSTCPGQRASGRIEVGLDFLENGDLVYRYDVLAMFISNPADIGESMN